MNENIFRENLINALTKEQAHVSLQTALENLKPENRNKKPSADLHSVWQLLEHIRISQEDIIQYTLDPDWKSPVWPDGYWPTTDDKISDEEWNLSIKNINNDLHNLIKLINNHSIDLCSVIPHTKNHTYLREILILIDHNSYHIAQIVQTRKEIGDWRSD